MAALGQSGEALNFPSSWPLETELCFRIGCNALAFASRLALADRILPPAWLRRQDLWLQWSQRCALCLRYWLPQGSLIRWRTAPIGDMIELELYWGYLMQGSSDGAGTRNWTAFYETLNEFAPYYLHPVEPWRDAAIQEAAGGSDAFWSEDVMDAVAENGTACVGSDVRFALALWVEAVVEHFSSFVSDTEMLANIHIEPTDDLVSLLAASLHSPE